MGNNNQKEHSMSLDQKIEGVLFYKAEPMKKKALADFFGVPLLDIESALKVLANRLFDGATRLVITDSVVQIMTAPELSDVIEQLKRDELKGDIGKAGAETLAIILYRGPLSRVEVDRIRGVNSTFIIRNLLMRGLIERRDNPKDTRSFLYAVTPALYAQLGITTREELPQFSDVLNQIDTFERSLNDADAENNISAPV